MPPFDEAENREPITPPDEPERWHLQKGIPVALITGLLFQFAVIVWGAAILFNNVDDHARRKAKLEAIERRLLFAEVSTITTIARQDHGARNEFPGNSWVQSTI